LLSLHSVQRLHIFDLLLKIVKTNGCNLFLFKKPGNFYPSTKHHTININNK